jgi:glycosyltransferase involved in cell wall biosynthesis
MRIAYASPLRPQASGVSDYSEELLPVLGMHAELTLVTDGITPANPTLALLPRLDLRELPARAHEFDTVVYHIGNAPLYTGLYETARQVPGVVVLHDLVLHHLRAWQTIERGNAAAYFDALQTTYGPAVAAAARTNPAALDRFEYPLSEELVAQARGVIVHSAYAAQRVRRAAPHVPVAQVPMGISPVPEISPEQARRQLALPLDAFLVAAFGEIHPHKRITVALEAFAEFVRRQPRAQFILVGAPSPNYEVDDMVRALGIETAVRRTGFVTMDAYANYIAASDICLNLRYPSAGETSASLLRLLSAGRVTLVTRTAAYAELPDAVCVKIEPDAHEKQLLVEMLDYFAAHPDARMVIGANARAYVARHHTLAQTAAGYLEFLAQFQRHA